MEYKFFDLGLVDYKFAWDFQKEIHSRVKNNEFYAAVIFCQHYPVVTVTRNTDRNHVLANQEELRKRKINIYEVERGGDVTYHGPGQLIIYPIVNLNCFKRDVHLFLRNLEGMAINILTEFGILGERLAGLTGVWVAGGKIASIGIAVKNWITFHGLAINIKQNDLENFSLIRPCGMDIMMTSMESVLSKEISIEDVKETLTRGWQYDESSLTGVGSRD